MLLSRQVFRLSKRSTFFVKKRRFKKINLEDDSLKVFMERNKEKFDPSTQAISLQNLQMNCN